MAFQISGSTIIDNSRGFLKYSDTLYTFGNTGAAPVLDLNNGNFIIATLNANAVFSFTNINSGAHAFTLVLTNDATAGRSTTWPASVKWPGGITPTRTTAANITDLSLPQIPVLTGMEI
jgi:hypothetical protein